MKIRLFLALAIGSAIVGCGSGNSDEGVVNKPGKVEVVTNPEGIKPPDQRDGGPATAPGGEGK